MSCRICKPKHFDDGFTQRIFRGYFGTAVWDEAQRLASLAQSEDTW